MHFEFWSFPRLGMCDNMCDKISPGDPGLGVSCLSAPRQPHDHKGKQPIQVKLFCKGFGLSRDRSPREQNTDLGRKTQS